MKLKSIVRLSLTAIFASASLGAWAQSTDDLGFGHASFTYGPTSSAYMTLQLSQCLEGVIYGTLDDTDFVMTDRLFRDANPSICEPPKPYPGTFFPDNYVFDIYGYPNANASDLCVTVNFDTGTCEANAHAQAFANGFDPNWGAANATNYLGDVGSSLSQPFSFVVPALTDWVLVVGNIFPGDPGFPLPCEYAFEVLDFPCDEDGDGVVDAFDMCPGTSIPELSVPAVDLGVNRFALVDGDFNFDTTPPKGEGPGRSYSTTDTAGCSCEQIIDAMSLGAGHFKFGCSISAMDEWVSMVGDG